MSLPLTLRLAARNLLRSLRRTLITGAAIAGGLTMMIASSNLQEGSYKAMIDAGVSEQAGHVVIEAPGFRDEGDARLAVADSAAVAAAVAAVAPPGSTVLRRALVPGLAQSPRGSAVVVLAGVEPSREAAVTGWEDRIVEGAFLQDGDARGILLGVPLAAQLAVGVGDKVVLMSQGDADIESRMFRVVGLVRTGAADLDAALALSTVDAAMELVGRPGGATQVSLHLAHPNETPAAHAAVAAALAGRGLTVLPWPEALPELLQFTERDRQSSVLLFGVLTVIVSMGVLNTVLMGVMERIREIGVMRALGALPGLVFQMVLWEAILLGGVSSAAGYALGMLLSWPFVVHGVDYSALIGETMEVGGVHLSAVVFPIFDWVGGARFALMTWGLTVLAALWPARLAARARPVEAMRHV
jgi:ABC-type lipoprotein release transport system permease subunit